jgi:hypothetical protein
LGAISLAADMEHISNRSQWKKSMTFPVIHPSESSAIRSG